MFPTTKQQQMTIDDYGHISTSISLDIMGMRKSWGYDYGNTTMNRCDNSLRIGELSTSFGHCTWDNDCKRLSVMQFSDRYLWGPITGPVGLPYPPEKCLLSATAICWSYCCCYLLKKNPLGIHVLSCLSAAWLIEIPSSNLT